MNPKVVLVGCGYWGKNWYNTLTKLDGVEITAVIDPNPVIPVANQVSSLERFDEGGYKYTHVVIAVQAEHHSTYVNYFKKKINPQNILVEKPCGLLTEPQEQYHGCFPGYLFLSTPHYKKIKSLLENKQLGDILYSQFRRASMGPRIRTDVSIIEDYMIHDLYIYLDLFNPQPEELLLSKDLASFFGNPIKPDTANIKIKYDNHTADFFSSWIYPQKERRIVIVGSKGSVIWEDDKLYYTESQYEKIDGVDSYGNVGWELTQSHLVDITPETKTSTLELEFVDFINCESRTNIQIKLNNLLKALVN